MLASLVDFLTVVGVNTGDIVETCVNQLMPCLSWAQGLQEIIELIAG